MTIRTLPESVRRGRRLLAFVATCAVSGCHPPAADRVAVLRPVPNALQDYALVWHDEFDGTALDPTKWAHRSLGPRRDAVNVKEAVTLDGDGHLLITTSRVGDEYHTGMISTQDLFEATYGYYEVSVKVQTQPGHWSAFWIHSPAYGQGVGDPHQYGVEIDVYEYFCHPKDCLRPQHAIHWDGYAKEHKSKNARTPMPDLHEGFHTFGLEWTPDELIFYADGRETWRTDAAVPRQDQYLILSLEVGPWAGRIATAALPDSLTVDYVRVYQRPEPIEPNR